MKIAVYDIGTNSIHLLIVEVRKDLSFEVLAHEKDVTRLGDGCFETREISREAIGRACTTLERFQKIAQASQVRRTLAVATSAVREARNGGAFVREVQRRAGIKVQVITGQEEARLIYQAARSSVDTRGRNALVVDIGGGSMEMILGRDNEILYLDSFRLGVARLKDHFLHHDPPTRKELRRLETHVEQELRTAALNAKRLGFAVVIGTAGTMINLGSMVHEEIEGRRLDFVNHFTVTLKTLRRVHEKLCRADLESRRRLPGLDPRRADLFPAGSLIVVKLLEMLGAESLVLSDRGIREGVVLDFIEKNKRRIRIEDDGLGIRERSVVQLARRCSYDQPHAEQVARLADRLFEITEPLHRLGTGERELLRYASLLHDIGYHVSYRKHHKHSYYLIVHSDLDGFSPEEIEIIGAVARYHRRQAPKRSDGHLARVGSKRGRRAVRVLSAILRVADGLDRSHFSVVKSLDGRVGRKAVTVRVRARQDAELELWQANERADLFRRVFGRPLVLQLQPPQRSGR